MKFLSALLGLLVLNSCSQAIQGQFGRDPRALVGSTREEIQGEFGKPFKTVKNQEYYMVRGVWQNQDRKKAYAEMDGGGIFSIPEVIKAPVSMADKAITSATDQVLGVKYDEAQVVKKAEILGYLRSRQVKGETGFLGIGETPQPQKKKTRSGNSSTQTSPSLPAPLPAPDSSSQSNSPINSPAAQSNLTPTPEPTESSPQSIQPPATPGSPSAPPHQPSPPLPAEPPKKPTELKHLPPVIRPSDSSNPTLPQSSPSPPQGSIL